MTFDLKNLPRIQPQDTLAAAIAQMVARFSSWWWECDASFPILSNSFTPGQQVLYEKQLEALVSDLIQAARDQSSGKRPLSLNDDLQAGALSFAGSAFGVTADQIEAVRKHGFQEAALEFARQARRFDPSISGDDIYQAGRNVMTMNLMQLLLGLPVQVTPAVFAYSMLYPYSDNYLDDPTISVETKFRFSRRFAERLLGNPISPANAYEEKIFNLVAMVEDQFERSRYPRVYESLMAIHAAQGKSLQQLRGTCSPYEVDVLGISFEKGGTSVLADGYLVAGDLSESQAEFMFGYGAFTQLMDDLEDVENDRQNGSLTIFTQTARSWPLDAVTNRTFHFGAQVFSLMDSLPSADARFYQEMILKAIQPLLILSTGSLERCYTRSYREKIQTHLPVRFSFLQKQRSRLARHKVTTLDLLRLAGDIG